MSLRYLALPLLALPLALGACGGGDESAAEDGTAATSSTASAPGAATLSNPAISSSLATMARKVRAAPSASAAAALSNWMIHVNGHRQIQVYIYAERLAPETKQALIEAGATDILVSQPLGLYQAWVSAEALAKIAALPAVTKITPPDYGFTRGGGHTQ